MFIPNAEFGQIKEFLLEVETYPELDILYESLKPASIKRSYKYTLNLVE